MKLSRFRARTLVVMVLLLPCVVSGQEEKPIETDLCSLIAHPKQFNKKRVRINARVESAVIEGGTWLEDAACKPHGVELSVPDSIRTHPEEHPDFKALDDAIRLQGNIGTVGKKITATFTGEFTSHSKRPKLVLTIEKVENLDVKIEKPQSKMQSPTGTDTVDPQTGNLHLIIPLGGHGEIESLG
ncbi:MAG TPA: hypothetical protein VGJ33_02505 [Candidatus Angelobacter sp.]